MQPPAIIVINVTVRKTEVSGNLGQTSTDFEESCKKSARNLGIDHPEPEKAAREAACCAPFV